MIRYVWLMTLLISMSIAANQCQLDAKALKASYQVTTMQKHNANGEQVINTSFSFVLHRINNRVIQHFPTQQLSHIWTRNVNNHIALTRAFDQYQQAIEYQSYELAEKPTWTTIMQPIPVPDRQKMQLVNRKGENCLQQYHYHWQLLDTEYQLVWLPALDLVQTFTVIENNQNKTWQLMSYETASPQSEQLYQHYLSFQTTDYADIGDNEDNVFLSKMINQGFSLTQSNHQHHGGHQH